MHRVAATKIACVNRPFKMFRAVCNNWLSKVVMQLLWFTLTLNWKLLYIRLHLFIFVTQIITQLYHRLSLHIVLPYTVLFWLVMHHFLPLQDCITSPTMISGGWFVKTLANIDLAITHFSVEKSLLGCNCVVPENIHTTPPIAKEVFGPPHLTSSTICSFETLQS